MAHLHFHTKVFTISNPLQEEALEELAHTLEDYLMANRIDEVVSFSHNVVQQKRNNHYQVTGVLLYKK